MPRFRLATMLIVMTVVALWLSTFAGYGAAQDVQAFIMLGCLITSGVAAFSWRGHRRAFWLGFFGTLLAASNRGMVTSFGPAFEWTREAAPALTRYVYGDPLVNRSVVIGTQLTIKFSLTLIVATVIGLLSVYVYDQASKR